MKLFGLIGYPLGHSFSKKYFNQKFENEGLTDCYFESFPIPSITEFPSLLSANPALTGIAVTIPYKEEVLEYVNELSEEVQFIGAANCIKVHNNKLTAYNTDIIGFEQSFIKSIQPHHTKALVLGTGGAAKAVQYVLKKLEIDFLVVTRNEKKTTGFINYEMIDEKIMASYPIIINCSPVGMSPNENACPAIPYHLLNAGHYLYDLVYQPTKTLFLKKGEEKGAVIENGYEMLLIQAEANWKIWNSD